MINIHTPLNTLGYGIHGLNIINQLHKQGIDMSLNPIGNTQLNSYYSDVIDNISFSDFDDNSPSLYIFHPSHLKNIKGSKVAAFAVFETTIIPKLDKYNLINNCDYVFTTTQNHKTLLILNGIPEEKIHVINEGIDPTLYNSEFNGKYIDTGKFTYITAGKFEKRKNTDLLIKTFIENMQYKEVALICHTFNPFLPGGGSITSKQFTGVDISKYGFNIVDMTQQYIKYSNSMCDIYFTYPISDQSLMKLLYHSANVGIYISRAEGWGLPLIETMACGIRCICSNVYGHNEYIWGSCDLQDSLIIEPSGKETADDGMWFKGNVGKWYTIDPDDLIDKLDDTYNNKFTISSELSKYYGNNFNWKKPVKKIIDVLL